MKIFAAIIAFLAIIFSADTMAQTRLDDTASPRARVDVTPRWLEATTDEMSDDAVNTLVAAVTGVEYRLNTAAYVGKNARIYLVLPLTITGLKSSGGIRAEWRTRTNFFLAGSVLPGSRTMVFTGKVSSAFTTETFDYVITVDARTMSRPLEFRPHFEIEIVP